MKIYSKRETLNENIALMALMASLNIIICLLSALFSVVSLFLILVLPLLSALVEIFCKDRYYPIYAFASLGLALVATLWNIDTTLFYLLPSLITGYLFGLLSKRNIPSIYAILFTSLTQMAITMIEIPLINMLFDVDIVITFKVFFKLENSTNIDVIIPSFVFVVSLIEMSLSYLIISNELAKLKIIEIENPRFTYINLISLITSTVISMITSLFSLECAYLFFLIALYFMVFIFGNNINKKEKCELICNIFSLLIGIIIYVIFNQKEAMKNNLLLLNIAPLLIGGSNIIVLFLKRRHKNIK